MGRKSHTQEHGGQGTLQKRAKQLAEDDLQKLLAENQTHEAMRLAREYTPGAVKRLNQLIHAKDTSPSARVAAVKAMHEIGYPKSAAGKSPVGGLGNGKLEITLMRFGDSIQPAKRLEMQGIAVKKLPPTIDVDLDD